jgi:hypothetical protein
MQSCESNKIYLKISKIFNPVIQQIEGGSLLLRYNKLTQLISIVKINLRNLIDKANSYVADNDRINQDKILDLMGDPSKKEIITAYLMIAEKIVSFVASIAVEKEATIEELTLYFSDLYMRFRSEADDILDLFLFKDEEERHNIIDDLVKMKIVDNHQKIVNKVADKYIFSKESSEINNIKITEIATLEDLFLKKEKAKYLTAIKILDTAEHEIPTLITNYLLLLTSIEVNSANNSKIKNIIGNPKRDYAEYDVVKRGYLTIEQASLFDYTILNSFGNYHESGQDNIARLFELAKSFYHDDIKRGLTELSKVDHNQVQYMLYDILLKALRKKIISIEQYINLSIEDKKVFGTLFNANQVEIVAKYGINPETVSSANCFYDPATGNKVVSMIKQIYNITPGDDGEKREKAIETFGKILTSNIILLKNYYQLYVVILYKLDEDLVKKAPCFAELDIASVSYELMRDACEAAPSSEKLSMALKIFYLISNYTEKNLIIALVKYEINKEQIESFACFRPSIIDFTMSILKKCYNQVSGGVEVKKASVLKIIDLIKNVDKKNQIETILLYGIDSNLVSQAKCFEHSKEINIGIAELLKLEQDYQKRTEFFTAICNLSLAKLVAIAIYKLPVSEVINAKCFADKECETKFLSIMSMHNVGVNINSSMMGTIFNLIKDCDTVSKMNMQTRAL